MHGARTAIAAGAAGAACVIHEFPTRTRSEVFFVLVSEPRRQTNEIRHLSSTSVGFDNLLLRVIFLVFSPRIVYQYLVNDSTTDPGDGALGRDLYGI